jgi:hypothetical protein
MGKEVCLSMFRVSCFNKRITPKLYTWWYAVWPPLSTERGSTDDQKNMLCRMKHEFHCGKPRFEKRSGEEYMFVETAPRRAQPKQRSRNYIAAHSLQVSNQSAFRSLQWHTSLLHSVHTNHLSDAHQDMGVRRPDHEVKHSPHLLTKSRVRETSPLTHESSHRDTEPQNNST